MTVPFALLSLVALACGWYVLFAMFPLRKQKGESWGDYYRREYWVPGNVFVVAAGGCVRTVGAGLSGLNVGLYFLLVLWALFLTIATNARRETVGY
jgi:hypothetical protein